MSTVESKGSPDSLAKLRIKRADDPPARSVWKRVMIFCLAVLAIGVTVVGLLTVRSESDGQNWMAVPDSLRSRPEVRVSLVTVESGRSADAVVTASGYLESRRQAKIGARAPGRIEVVHVEEGNRVKDQQILAVLEHADMDASVAAAQAVLERSRAEVSEQDVEIARTKREFDRAESLRKSGGISEADYDSAKFQYEGAVARRWDSLSAAVSLAEARVQEAEQLRENMFIRASFDGTVISKDAEVGESILPGGMGEASGRGSVVTIADLDHLESECDVKEDYISRVSVGQEAEVTVDAVPDRRYRGRVRKVIPMGDRARATIKVKVEILDADERLFPEMSSTVYFLPSTTEVAATDAPRIFCLSDAVLNDEHGDYVWLVDEDDRVLRADIKAGAERNGRTEIAEGLAGGERVVVGPPQTLRNGTAVKAVQ